MPDNRKWADRKRSRAGWRKRATGQKRPHDREAFDSLVGRLDRVLSELLVAAALPLDEPDRQTLKHHADDLVGVAGKMRELIGR